ncbi:MAG: deaminase, partial [Chloroflexota bacterium]
MPLDFESLDHVKFMREALKEAEIALQQEERPIGAVIVHHGKIIGRGRAQHLKRHSEIAHA